MNAAETIRAALAWQASTKANAARASGVGSREKIRVTKYAGKKMREIVAQTEVDTLEQARAFLDQIPDTLPGWCGSLAGAMETPTAWGA